jgi:hypothetical protein
MLAQDKVQLLDEMGRGAEDVLAYVQLLPEEVWSFKPAPEKWSIKEIVGHLADVDAKMYGPRLRRMVAENNPFLPSLDQNEFVIQGRHQEKAPQDLLAEFRQAREANLAFLRQTEDKDWQRTGQHEEYGRMVFSDIIRERLVPHDRKHLEQMKRNVAAFQIR